MGKTTRNPLSAISLAKTLDPEAPMSIIVGFMILNHSIPNLVPQSPRVVVLTDLENIDFIIFMSTNGQTYIFVGVVRGEPLYNVENEDKYKVG